MRSADKEHRAHSVHGSGGTERPRGPVVSRNNDGLPMLPPWLSESDVTQVGYEAPVQNLPADDLIEEAPSRGPGRLKGPPQRGRPPCAPR